MAKRPASRARSAVFANRGLSGIDGTIATASGIALGAPAPTTVLLVRHGRTSTTGSVLPGRAPGLHLSDAGHAQAEHAARRIGALTIGAVYASPLERTRETAAPIARATGCRTRTARGLVECDFGDWTGRKLSALDVESAGNRL